MTEQLHISNPDSSELTPTTGEHDDDQPDYSPEEMAQLNAATTGVIDILNGAPKSNNSTVETNEGIKSLVEGTVPGGNVIGLFGENDGHENVLQSVILHLEPGQDGMPHAISVQGIDTSRPEILVDGKPVPPELIPGVADVIAQIQQEQADQENEAPITDTADRDNMTLAA
jgi:hypothetical protein